MLKQKPSNPLYERKEQQNQRLVAAFRASETSVI